MFEDTKKLNVNAVGVSTGMLPNEVVFSPSTLMPDIGFGVIETDDAVSEPILFKDDVNVNNEPTVGIDGRRTVFIFIKFMLLRVKRFNKRILLSGCPFNI